jgi:tetratricopeptide (TPR) repeat protein
MLSSDRWEWVDRLTDSMRQHEDARQESRKSLPRYEILGELGRGGMAVVYRAWDPELGRPVALKVLQQNLGTSPEMRERFSREAQMASRLDHPNIVTVYDSGEWEGQGFLAMRLVEGTTLDKADLDLRGKLAALRDAARALDHAHRQGVVHRDVKPSNLLVDREGHVYVSDFGVARRIDLPSKLTLTGVTVGTPAYISPEQAQGREVDPRSDVYSLGAAMYEVLCGRPPFPGTDALKVMAARLTEDPPPPSRFRPDLSRALDKIVQKAMEREADHRYPTAAALADDLQRYLDGEPIQARPAPLRFRARRFLSRHGWRVVAGSLLALLLSTVALFSVVSWKLGELRREFDSALIREDFGRALEVARAVGNINSNYAEKLEQELKRKVEDVFKVAIGLEDFEKAGTILDLVRRLYPDDYPAFKRQLRLAVAERDLRVALEGRNLAKVREVIEGIRGLDPKEYPNLEEFLLRIIMKEFEGAFNRDDFAWARKLIEEIEKLDPKEGVRRAEALRQRELAVVLSRFGKAMFREDLDNAVAFLPDIERLDRREAGIRLHQYLELKFARGLRLLPEYAMAVDVDAFDRLHAALSGPEFEDQPDRPRLREFSWRLAVELLGRGQPAGALRWLTGPHDPGEERRDPLRVRALARLGAGDADGALADLRLLDRGRRVGEAADREYLGLLRSLAGRKKEARLWPEALALLDEAAAADPAFAGAFHDRGLVRSGTSGDARAALRDLESALNLDPKLVPDRGYAVMALGLAKALHEEHWKSPDAKAREAAWSEAIRWLSLVRNVEPREPVRLELAGMLRRARRYPEALKELEGLEGTAAGLFARGQIKLVKRDSKEALQDFEEAARREPNNGRILHWLGACHQDLDREDKTGESLRALRRAVELGRDVPDVHLRVGILSCKSPTTRESILETTRALEGALRLGEDCYALRAGEGRGIPYLEVVRDFRRDAAYTRARARYEEKDKEGCIADCGLCVQIDPAYSRGFLLRAIARCGAGDHRAAIEDCDRVVDLVRNSTESDDKECLKYAIDQKKTCMDQLKP